MVSIKDRLEILGFFRKHGKTKTCVVKNVSSEQIALWKKNEEKYKKEIKKGQEKDKKRNKKRKKRDGHRE